MLTYPTVLKELDGSEGGGYLVEVPDLPGCIADGESAEEALENAHAAISEWIDAATELGREIPEPNPV